MTVPLVQTKIFIPKLTRAVVSRPRLTEPLGRGAAPRLILLCAPAGFGKTTLLAEGLAAEQAAGRAVAWLALDEGDAQAATFWTNVITAVQAVVPGVGAGVLPLLQSAQPPFDAVVATLLNDLNAVPKPLMLVLDDYHLADSLDVQPGMAFLLEHLPAHVHLVIASRADPTLPLSKWRVRGELVEIRSADLRFTPAEAAEYLNEIMGLALTTADVTALEARTEGWIAALQLAALSLQGRSNITAFIASFAGDDRYIVDYLVEEVLTRQPQDVRDFLLRTSILARLNGGLCDAVLGRNDGQAVLVALERANLFLVSLDDRRLWYRYHRLFADVLLVHLKAEHAEEIPQLHQRASAWFEDHAEPAEAIRHALSGNDFDRAASLMEAAIPEFHRNRQEAEIRAWARMLPADVVRVRPVLGMGIVGALASGNEFGTVEERLRDIERFVVPATVDSPGPGTFPPGAVVVDARGYVRLSGGIELYRAALHLVRGDLGGTVRHGQRALELATEDDYNTRAAAAGLWGLASWTTGDLEAAHQAFVECVAGLRQVGFVSDVLGCSTILADIRRIQGRLGDALDTYVSALALASPPMGAPPLRGTADMHVGISEVLRERDDRAGAALHLAISEQLGPANGLPRNAYRWRVAMAALRESEGDLDDALVQLGEADRVYDGDYAPNVRPVPALRARLRIRRGELDAAADWAQERQVHPDDELSYLREFEHVTLARLLLARHSTVRSGPFLDEATGLLTRLLEQAEQGGRTATVVEVLILQALAHQARGDSSRGDSSQEDIAAALPPLQRALELAEPERFVRIFADEGSSMASLLRTLTTKDINAAYVRRLLTATVGTAYQPLGTQALIEPLSEREFDVLRLLATDLDGPAMARQLVVSLNTLRTHTRHVYTKLGVNNRRAAVRRARDLDLLSRSM